MLYRFCKEVPQECNPPFKGHSSIQGHPIKIELQMKSIFHHELSIVTLLTIINFSPNDRLTSTHLCTYPRCA